MGHLPSTYNIAKLSKANIEYKLIIPDKVTQETTIVFLYGLVCNNRHWEFQLDFFLSNGFKILLHNYRYHYGSIAKENSLKENLTFTHIAEDVEELLNHLKIDKVFYIGHSMGVNVSLELVKRGNNQILGQILISGNPIDPKDTMFNTNKSHEVIPILKKFLETKPFIFNKFWKHAHRISLVRKVVLHGGFHPEMITDEFVEYYLKKIGELGPEVFFQLLDQMGKQSIITFLPNVNVPTLIMGGDKDTIAPISSQLVFINLIPKSEFYLIKDGSHVPQADFPDSVNQKILNFIENNI